MGASRISRSMVFFPTCWNMSNILSHQCVEPFAPLLPRAKADKQAQRVYPRVHGPLVCSMPCCPTTCISPLPAHIFMGEERAISPFGHSSLTCSHTPADKDILISPASLSVAARNKPHRMGKTPSQRSSVAAVVTYKSLYFRSYQCTFHLTQKKTICITTKLNAWEK